MKQENYLITEALKDIISQTEIIDDLEVMIKGKMHQFRQHEPIEEHNGDLNSFGNNQPLKGASLRFHFQQFLSSLLYANFYCGNSNDLEKQLPPKKERDEFMQTLSEANTTKTGYDYYWQVYNIDQAGNIFVSKNEYVKQLLPNTYVFSNSSIQKPELKTYVHLIRYKEDKNAQPVFYYLFGEKMQHSTINLSRIYFNITAQGAPLLVNQVSLLFNKYSIPFSFKCLNHSDLYTRNDSAVLYIEKQYLNIASALLNNIIPVIRPYLKPYVPLFTMMIHPGISFAEDPGNGNSFGMHRCTMLAGALMEIRGQKLKNEQEKLDIVHQYLAAHGLQLNHPYLNTHTQVVPVFSKQLNL